MSEQLLDRAQIRAAVEEMGREGVSQGVRVHGAAQTGELGPDAKASTNV